MRRILIAIALTAAVTGCASNPTVAQTGECRIDLNGFGDAQIGSVTAETVSIVVDGHSSLRISSLTSGSIDTEVNGFGRFDVRDAAPLVRSKPVQASE